MNSAPFGDLKVFSKGAGWFPQVYEKHMTVFIKQRVHCSDRMGGGTRHFIKKQNGCICYPERHPFEHPLFLVVSQEQICLAIFLLPEIGDTVMNRAPAHYQNAISWLALPVSRALLLKTCGSHDTFQYDFFGFMFGETPNE